MVDDMAVGDSHKLWLGMFRGEASPQEGAAALEQVTWRGQGL